MEERDAGGSGAGGDSSRPSSPNFEGFSFEGGMSATRDAHSQSVDYNDESHVSNTEAAILASSGTSNRTDGRVASVSEGEGTDAGQSTSLSVDSSSVETSAVF